MAQAVTPQVFFDLLIICLSWEWEEAGRKGAAHLKSPFSYFAATGDKVARILYGLNIITEETRKKFYKDPRLQRLVYRNMSQTHSLSQGVNLITLKEKLLLIQSMTRALDRAKMLRTGRLYPTSVGLQYAESIKTKYPQLTKEAYMEEIRRQSAQIKNPERSMPAIMKKYRQKVADDE